MTNSSVTESLALKNDLALLSKRLLSYSGMDDDCDSSQDSPLVNHIRDFQQERPIVIGCAPTLRSSCEEAWILEL